MVASEHLHPDEFPNPTHNAHPLGEAVLGPGPGGAIEWIPPWRVTSFQKTVRRGTVDNADPDAAVGVVAYEGTDGEGPVYDLYDGNNRTAAALEQGRLLIPAQVLRGLEEED